MHNLWTETWMMSICMQQSPGDSKYQHTCHYFCEVCLFSNISHRMSTFRQNAKAIDTRKPSAHIGRGLRVIRTVCPAWEALKVLFAAGEDNTIPRGFCIGPSIHHHIYTYSGVHTYTCVKYASFAFFLEHSPEPRQLSADNNDTMQRPSLPAARLRNYNPATHQQQQREAPCACGRSALWYGKLL